MSFDVEEFVRYQIANAPLRRHPFAHFFVQPILPHDYYERLIGNLPPLDWYQPIDETGSVTGGKSAYPERFITDLASVEEHEQRGGKDSFWLQVSSWLMGNRFRGLILEKFRSDIALRFGEGASIGTDIDARLVRDFTRYAIGPHTDSPRKLVSLLFYLPRDESMRHLGTSIYTPIDPAFRCRGGPHHRFEGFKKTATMPYLPNSLFAFFKTDGSFHGVDQILDDKVERDLLLYNIYVQGVSAPRRRGLRWPWSRQAA